METLSRDDKTASRTLAQLKAKHEDMERNQERLCGEEETQRANKSEVRVFQN
jgi:structural maintenance of chromosome 1